MAPDRSKAGGNRNRPDVLTDPRANQRVHFKHYQIGVGGGVAAGDITQSALTMTTQRLLGNSDAAGGTGDIQEIVLASDNLTLSNGALQVVSIGTDVIDDASITTEKLEDDAVTLDKAAFDIHDSVLLTHVTNTGSVTSVSLQQGGQALGENEVGVPVDRACTSNNAVVTWRAGTAPAGTWTLTLKKKAAGSRSYTTAATMTVNVNNG